MLLCSSSAASVVDEDAERSCFPHRDRGVGLGAISAADAQERAAPSSRPTAGTDRGQHATDAAPWDSSEVK